MIDIEEARTDRIIAATLARHVVRADARARFCYRHWRSMVKFNGVLLGVVLLETLALILGGLR